MRVSLDSFSVEERSIAGEAGVVHHPRTSAAFEARVQPRDSFVPAETHVALVIATDT